LYPDVKRLAEPESTDDAFEEFNGELLRDTARFAMTELIKLTMHSIDLRRQYLKDVRFME